MEDVINSVTTRLVRSCAVAVMDTYLPPTILIVMVSHIK